MREYGIPKHQNKGKSTVSALTTWYLITVYTQGVEVSSYPGFAGCVAWVYKVNRYIQHEWVYYTLQNSVFDIPGPDTSSGKYVYTYVFQTTT